jgi:anti-anti-sigma factor
MDPFRVDSQGPTSYKISGELDMATVSQLEEGTADASLDGPVMYNLAGLSFMDSTGLWAIVRAAKRLTSGCLVLHGVKGEVKRVLDLAGLESGTFNLHIIPCPLGTQG